MNIAAARWLAITAVAASCSAPVLQRDLAAAERYERAGNIAAARAAYRTAQTSCQRIRMAHVRRQTCGQAHIGYAELLEDQGDKKAAADAYEATPAALERDPVPSAKATYRAGRLRLSLGEDKRGYALLWRAVTDYPDVAYAVDAIRVLFNDGRKRAPRQLYTELAMLVEPLAGNDVSDNILFDLAVLAEEDFHDAPTARKHLDTIIANYPEGGMFDEACWHAARISRSLGDGKGAAKRLRILLATREVALGPGSYFSVWLDNAQLELGRVLRDDLRDYPASVRVLRQLPKDYPASILIDDATWELANTWHAAGNDERACQALARLHRTWPDSKFELTRAPELRNKLGCPRQTSAAETR